MRPMALEAAQADGREKGVLILIQCVTSGNNN